MTDSKSFPSVQEPPKTQRRTTKVLGLVSVLVLGAWLWCSHKSFGTSPVIDVSSLGDACPQEPSYNPAEALRGIELKPPRLADSVRRLSESIQIDTSVGEEVLELGDRSEFWSRIFQPFADWIHDAYPRIHSADSPVKREFVNEHGLLYTWPGSNRSLKPLLLMAHQDVVPVQNETLNEWFHPPFSGYVDLVNQTVWGRGAIDCKLLLTSILSAVESLLESNFTPQRTVILSFGQDEETHGTRGAKHIAAELERRYGRDSVALIVDEGIPVLAPTDLGSYGMPLAAPSVTERGMADMMLTAHASGGHSSMPPPPHGDWYYGAYHCAS